MTIDTIIKSGPRKAGANLIQITHVDGWARRPCSENGASSEARSYRRSLPESGRVRKSQWTLVGVNGHG